MKQELAKVGRMTPGQRWNLAWLVLALAAYAGLTVSAPPAATPSPYHFSGLEIAILGLTIVGLFLLACGYGFYAWLELDRYTRQLPAGASRWAFSRMTRGVWFLVAGLILPSALSSAQPFYAAGSAPAVVMAQVSYYVIILFPCLGFYWLRTGSRHLAVSAQAVMTTRDKLVTVGPPVVLLAAFYIFLALTNSSPGAETLLTGPAGFLVLPLSILLTVGAWVFGLLAALNVERATYRGEGTKSVQPLVKLYNGILTTTGGFIILDALLSLGATRLSALPVGFILLLAYAFVGVVALGFFIVAASARELAAAEAAKTNG